MNFWPLIVAAVAVILVLIVGIERYRNCRYADGEKCGNAVAPLA